MLAEKARCRTRGFAEIERILCATDKEAFATKFAAIQTVATPDVARNLDTAGRLIARAASAGATWVALPEYFCLMGLRDDAKLAIAEPDGDGPIQRFLSDAARTHKVTLVGGTLPIHAKTPGRVRNACCVYGPDGARLARYDEDVHRCSRSTTARKPTTRRVLEPGDTPVAF